MKKKIIVFTLICTLLLICSSILCVCANGITSQATFDGNIATISGTVTGASGATQVTLLVGEPGDIIYVDQVTSEADGRFSFEVPFSSSTPFGEYPYRIGSGARVGTYEGVIDYKGAVTYVTNQFLTADLNVSVNAYIPTITGTISCTEGKTVDVTVTNVTDNTVIAEETITSADGEHAVSYTLPTLMSTKEYSLVVTVNDGSTQQVALNVSIDCKILSVEGSGSITLSDNTWVEMQMQSVGSDFINKSGTVTTSKDISLEIPNLVAYADIDVLAKGYETVVRYEENTPTEPDDSEDEEGEPDGSDGEEDSNKPDDSEDIVNKVIQNTHEDEYGNSIENATEITNILSPVLGTVDSDNSDYISFIAPTTGTYMFDNISLEGADVALYSSEKEKLISGMNFEYNLIADDTYYLEFTSASVCQYILTAVFEPKEDANNFNIYEYDEKVTVYKKEIEALCENIYYEDADKSKNMYTEYNRIADIETDLHMLPGFLGTHPKDISDYDGLINRYYRIYYDEFSKLEEMYIDMISDYDNEYEYSEPGHIYSPKSVKIPVTYIDKSSEEYIEYSNQHVTTWARAKTPSLTIDSMTATSVKYTVVYPNDRVYGNGIFLIDFNRSDGLTKVSNVFRTIDDSGLYKASRTYTLKDLEPGGEYILYMTWASDDGSYFGGDCSICRRIKLPYDYDEEKAQYDGEHISALIEIRDRELANSSDFDTWLDRMDLVYESLEDLTGNTPYGGRSILLNSTRDNLSDLYDSVDGENWWEIITGYSGNPVTCGQSSVKSLMNRLEENDWGDLPIHELSHDFDKNIWEFDDHTLCYLKMHYVLEVLNARVYREDVGTDKEYNNNVGYSNIRGDWYRGSYYDFLYEDYYDSYQAHFAEKEEYCPAGMASILIRIQEKIGWEPFRKTFRYFSSLDESQIPRDDGEKLKLFLTKLKDYSGYDILFYKITPYAEEIIEDFFDISLNYVDAPYPLVVSDFGKVYEIKNEYSVFQFEPEESANYNIFTSPFYNSGLSNDTYLEVYSDYDMTELIVANDDYDGTRFSKVTLSATAGRTYYIKVRHYSDGYLQSMLNVVQYDPVGVLTLDEPLDIISRSGEYEMMSFTPETSGVYAFGVTNYNDGDTEYDTYIKLYSNENKSELVGKHSDKVIARLKANHTYYLQFSGIYMSYARGRVCVKPAHMLEFKNSTDGNFIFVNSPEFITNRDIIDSPKSDHLKLFEEENITGKNTYYQTHTAWPFANVNLDKESYEYWLRREYYTEQNFYVDIDFYNPTSSVITVDISKMAYGVIYDEMLEYFNLGEIEEEFNFEINPGEHKLLFETLCAVSDDPDAEPMLVEDARVTGKWASVFMILFDFEISGGYVTISSLAAYDRDNLNLTSWTKNVLENGDVLDSGEIIYKLDEYGKLNWESDANPRPLESDLWGKVKGIAKNQSSVIEVNMDFLVDDSTPFGEHIDIHFKDDYYVNGIDNPKSKWFSNLNPFNDSGYGLIYALPSHLHSFKYHRDKGGIWNFGAYYKDFKEDINEYATGTESINKMISTDTLENAKYDVKLGWKSHFLGTAVDGHSSSLGEYGATYRYTITVLNNSNFNRKFTFRSSQAENLCTAVKFEGSEQYTTKRIELLAGCTDGCEESPDCSAWKSLWDVSIPPKSTYKFEILTMLISGAGGPHFSVAVDWEERK